MAPLKCPLGGWILGAWRAENEPSPFPWKSKTKSQRSNPKWLLQYLTTPTFCAKFQPNRLTTTFGFRKTLPYLPSAVFIALMPVGLSKFLMQAWPRIWTRNDREQIQQAVRARLELGASELLAWDHALSLLSLYVSHEKRAWYISLSDHM